MSPNVTWRFIGIKLSFQVTGIWLQGGSEEEGREVKLMSKRSRGRLWENWFISPGLTLRMRRLRCVGYSACRIYSNFNICLLLHYKKYASALGYSKIQTYFQSPFFFSCLSSSTSSSTTYTSFHFPPGIPFVLSLFLLLLFFSHFSTISLFFLFFSWIYRISLYLMCIVPRTDNLFS